MSATPPSATPPGTAPAAPTPPTERHVAAGGWRRIVVGLAIGALAGLAAVAGMSRDGSDAGGS